MNSLFQINTEIKGSVKLREKTLALAINSPMFSAIRYRSNKLRLKLTIGCVYKVSLLLSILHRRNSLIGSYLGQTSSAHL